MAKQTKAEFIDFLRTTLVPDLRTSGMDMTADDFDTCIKFMEATQLEAASKCALADLIGIMPEHDPSGEREAPGWKTIVELYDALKGVADVTDYATEVQDIRESLTE